ncbi:gpW family head-tail joining protein [Escherichia coli]
MQQEITGAAQYSQASIEQLRTYIIELKSQLGLSTGRRRPVGVRL